MIVARLCAAAIGVCVMAAPASIDANSAQAASMHVTGPIVVALSLAAAAPALDCLRWLLVPAGARPAAGVSPRGSTLTATTAALGARAIASLRSAAIVGQTPGQRL